MSTRSRSAPPGEEGLRLPRPPGVIRRFWARHPVLADVLIALLCLFFTLTPPATFRSAEGADPHPSIVPLMVLTVATCALLLRRRQWPVAVFTASYLLAFAFLFAPAPVGPMTVLFASYSLAVYGSSAAAWRGLGIGLGALAALGSLLSVTGAVAWNITLNAVVSEAMLALIGTLIGVNIGNRKRYVEAIIDRSRQLLRERDQQGQLAAAAERARIAREMHDIVSHSLTVIVALTEGASATPNAERSRAATAQAADTARAALREMREMLGVLRDGSGEPAPLLPADEDLIGTAVESARRAGFPVTFRSSSDALTMADLPRTARFAAGRVVQEGLTNAMRHAPGATRIDVTVTVDERGADVVIHNDGVQRTADSGGYGLQGIRERVQLAGGTVEAGEATAGTWLLRARLPAGPPLADADRAASKDHT